MTARWVTVAALVVACAGCASGASPEHYGPPRTPCAYPRTPPAIRAAPAAHRGLLVGLSASVRYWHGNQKCHLLAAVTRDRRRGDPRGPRLGRRVTAPGDPPLGPV